ncbi:hypothetical protein ABMY44_01305 [Pseudoalteromonas sp. Cnat2-41]|uniref:hypothetical protein n=1 Tax=unclassified Pseudoalteromonas TaxID=194690 RepID=UPI001EF8EB97|nr:MULTISPECIES: hypothetical protein [unclassified Pseudoalteromonas]MCF2860799.1 hypothetical protein [Pseudoalteromonas sp. CNAT2-18]MCG7556668.1 hypothetical protein [Pseudoalteromonas sp. CNAT2-18.1]
MTKLNLITVTALFGSLSVCAKTGIEPRYTLENKAHSFFDKRIELKNSSEIAALHNKQWYYQDTLNKGVDFIEVSNCLELKKALAEGFEADTYSYQEAVIATKHICDTWQAMAKLEASHSSWINFTHGKEVAKELPAEFALAISNDTVERVAQSEHWSDVTTIKKVEPASEDQAVYYDTDGSIQRLTLMAQGDYNGDGIEDAIFYMENGVDGGSYSSVNTYIVTRLQQGAPITLLAKW